MINLSECKFGDKLKTRDGRMALFLGEIFVFVKGFVCAIKGEGVEFSTEYYKNDGTALNSVHYSKYDIVGKWEDGE